MPVHDITSKDEFETTIKAHKVIVLDAFATWCGPCKTIAPQVDKLSDQYNSAHFVKLDVDEVPEVAQNLGIRAIPTFIIFKNGERVEGDISTQPRALEAAIKAVVEE